MTKATPTRHTTQTTLVKRMTFYPNGETRYKKQDEKYREGFVFIGDVFWCVEYSFGKYINTERETGAKAATLQGANP